MISIKENSVEAVNAMRVFCQTTFGVNPDLKDTIAFLDALMCLQEAAANKARFTIVKGSTRPPSSDGNS